MANERESPASTGVIAQPRFHQRAPEIQAHGTVNHLLPLELEEPVRQQTATSIFAARPTAATWHKKLTWYVVASNDNMIAPDQEKSMANQMKATTTVLASSHVAMLSKPKEVAKVIEDAVSGAPK